MWFCDYFTTFNTVNQRSKYLDFPNHSWNDTSRESAEIVVLSFALAAAEGVKNALYYQLFNSVWNNQLGVREDNHDYDDF